MKFTVYLYKSIRAIPSFGDKRSIFTGEYVRRVELPIPPFIRLCVCDRFIDKEDVIEHVWITPRGAVICEVQKDTWEVGEVNSDATPEGWPSQLAYETEGWTELKDGADLENLVS